MCEKIYASRQKCGNLVTMLKSLHIFLVTLLMYNTVTNFVSVKLSRLPSYQEFAYSHIMENKEVSGNGI